MMFHQDWVKENPQDADFSTKQKTFSHTNIAIKIKKLGEIMILSESL